MMVNSLNGLIHTHTPVISVHDPRSLVVREVRFYRRAVEHAVQARVTHQTFDAMRRPVASRDPRLFALAQADDDVPANLVSIFSLSGAVLFSDSVDAGWRLALHGEAGQTLERWDGREARSVMAYDELLRPLAITEHAQVVERFNYAAADSQAAAHNLCGQVIRHDDPAGSEFFEEYSIGGAVLQSTRRFLQAIEAPDWPLAEAARDELLEPLPGAVTRYATNPWTDAIGQIDAQGNVQRLDMTCAGALRSSHLQLAGQAEQVLVSDIRYNAFGQVEAETAGNGVQTHNVYDPATGLLQRLKAHKADGTALQDLNYEYDPLGNILGIEDVAQPIRYFRNQAIDAVSTYRYDTLYQLIEATGREALDAGSGPQLPPFQSPADPNQLANHSQRYDYDAGGNLQNLSHIGGQHYTREMITARSSNRSLPVIDDHIPDEAELAAAFDANGNLLELQRGQALTWDLRNQLQQITPVQREDAEDDHERYVYDGNGQRLRKVRITQAANISHRAEVRYLPGLEIRTDTATGEIFNVIIAPAGRCDVRVLHWQQGKPDGLSNDQLRYSLSDHLGSSTLELDDGANIISQESYYPFGGTAWWAGRSAIEANYKTVRYSGKERDASGLYYYGFRYYVPWLFRWINPDPLVNVAALNLYEMVDNNPVGKCDQQGLAPVPYQVEGDIYEKSIERRKESILARGRAQIALLPQPNPALFDQGLEISQLSLDVTKSEFASLDPSDNLKGAVMITMGMESLRYFPALSHRYTSLSRVVQEYRGDERHNQFVIMEGSTSQAYVINTDPHKRVFVSDKLLSKHTLSATHTFSHELSHVMPGRTEDFAYLDRSAMSTVQQSISKQDFDQHLRNLMESSRQLSSGERNDYMFARFEETSRKPHVKVDTLMRLFEVNSAQDLKVERLSHPPVRASLLRQNADSVAGLAMFMAQKEIVSKLQSRGQYHT